MTVFSKTVSTASPAKSDSSLAANGVDFVDDGMGGVTRAGHGIQDLAYNNYMTQGSFAQTGLQSGAVQTVGSFPAAYGGATILSTLSGGVNSGGFSIPNLGSLGAGIPSLSMIGQQLKAGAAGAIGAGVAGIANQVVGELGKLVNSAANEVLGDLGLGGVGGANLIGGLAAAISNPAAAAATVVGGVTQYATKQISGALQQGIGEAGKALGGAVSSAYETVSTAASDVAGEAKALYYEATTDTSGYSDLF
jgi:hypothetical protein